MSSCAENLAFSPLNSFLSKESSCGARLKVVSVLNCYLCHSSFESAITFSPKQHVKDVKMQYYYFITVSYGSDPFFFLMGETRGSNAQASDFLFVF
jgi:hypothetical protein